MHHQTLYFTCLVAYLLKHYMPNRFSDHVSCASLAHVSYVYSLLCQSTYLCDTTHLLNVICVSQFIFLCVYMPYSLHVLAYVLMHHVIIQSTSTFLRVHLLTLYLIAHMHAYTMYFYLNVRIPLTLPFWLVSLCVMSNVSYSSKYYAPLYLQI